ncbi:MAG: hypothetical protein QOH71_3344 [Blastocatellia bacterium]|nr:hypothetical protein [Blastocatellia bacterium]
MRRMISKLKSAFVGLLLIAAAGVIATAQTNPKVTPIGKRPSAEKEIEGVKKTEATNNPPQYRELRCRGGELRFVVVNGRTTSSGEQTMYMTVDFKHAGQPAGLVGRSLQPGECAFVDRALRSDEPDQIIQEIVSFGQLKEKLHGSTVDSSPTAAERFPDAKNVPQYLSDARHYWTFFVRQNGPLPAGRFESSFSRYWKPGIDPVRPLDSARRSIENSGVLATRPDYKSVVVTSKVGSEPKNLNPKLVNDGTVFQLICRGGSGLHIDGNYDLGAFTWPIAFSHSTAPAHSGRTLQPGQCSPAEFSLRDSDPAELETVMQENGAVQGIILYPWEKSIEEVAQLDPSTRLIKFRDYLHDPKNYWSFFVKDYGDGYFIADYSKDWQPELYKGTPVRPFDERRKNKNASPDVVPKRP